MRQPVYDSVDCYLSHQTHVPNNFGTELPPSLPPFYRSSVATQNRTGLGTPRKNFFLYKFLFFFTNWKNIHFFVYIIYYSIWGLLYCWPYLVRQNVSKHRDNSLTILTIFLTIFDNDKFWLFCLKFQFFAKFLFFPKFQFFLLKFRYLPEINIFD